MSRKQIVRIQWAILLSAAVILVIFCILGLRGSFSKRSSQKTDEEQKGTKTIEAGGLSDPELQTESETDPEETCAPDSPRSYTLSFAGDCTIGSLLEWQGTQPGDFQSVVGTNYAYPLSGVLPLFSQDDFTVVNLEGTFTNSDNAVVKPYRFKADPAYARVLAEGSVEAVSASNNHSYDFQEEGVKDTLAALDAVGIQYTRAGTPLITELEGGLSLGIISYNTVENWEDVSVWKEAVKTDIEKCREDGCDLIIGFMHWGTVEYLPEPEDWEVEFAHYMADWGCDLIVGGHAHILQRMEFYHDVPIFYSMGNFCYGGNLNPDDKDSVIIQAEYVRDPAIGEVARSGLHVVPCLVSTRTDKNDYCPTPCPEGSTDYRRILERLEWKKEPGKTN